MTHLSIKQIKLDVEKLATLDEKKKFLEDVLKKIRGQKLKTAVEKLLAEIQKQLQQEEKLAPAEKLEQKLATTSGAEEFSGFAAAEAVSAEPPKYIPRRQESRLERDVGFAMPLRPSVNGEKKYARPEISVPITYHEARETIQSLRTYFTQILGVNLQMIDRDPQFKAEIEGHLNKVFSLGESSQDLNRRDSYIGWLKSTGEGVKKYKV